jgi:hypothetical protein
LDWLFFIDRRYVALDPANRDSTDQPFPGIFFDQSTEFLRQNESTGARVWFFRVLLQGGSFRLIGLRWNLPGFPKVY